MARLFRDRSDAGRVLAGLLGHCHARDDVIEPARIVVWAHNSHLGDAAATEVAARGEFTVGQLVREHHPGESRLIGFTTYTGTVTAADEWGAPAQRKQVFYRPHTERVSHYFRARLADQFDAVIHIDETSALEPLERTAQWEAGEVPESYPHAV